jgi:hypothetical protein
MFGRANEDAFVLFQRERDVCGRLDDAAQPPRSLSRREQSAPELLG